MAPMNKYIENKKPAKKASNKDDGAKKIGQKKTTGTASMKRPTNASKKMQKPAKKSMIVKTRRNLRSMCKTPVSLEEEKGIIEVHYVANSLTEKVPKLYIDVIGHKWSAQPRHDLPVFWPGAQADNAVADRPAERLLPPTTQDAQGIHHQVELLIFFTGHCYIPAKTMKLSLL